MREGTFEYAVTARCALADAVALMSEVERLGQVHPLVTKVVPVSPTPMALHSYQVAGTLRWGPVRIPVRQHADVISVSDLEVVLATRQWPRTTTWITAQFQEDGEKVHIVVTVRVRAPAWVFPFAYRTGTSTHLELAERLRPVLEE